MLEHTPAKARQMSILPPLPLSPPPEPIEPVANTWARIAVFVNGSCSAAPPEQARAATNAMDALQRSQLPCDNPSYLPGSAVESALAEFLRVCPPPSPAVHTYSMSQTDKNSWQGLRAPIQAVSVSYAVVHFADKAGISKEEAEAVLAHFKQAEGHRTNALLAQQVFARFAKAKSITVTGAIITMREWAEGRE